MNPIRRNEDALQQILGNDVSVDGDYQARVQLAQMISRHRTYHDGPLPLRFEELPPDLLQAAFPSLAPAARLALSAIEPPAYDYCGWTEDPQVQLQCNCYAYAANCKRGGCPQPGTDKAPRQYQETNNASLTCAALFDGFIPTGSTLVNMAGHYAVALFVSKDNDFHWCRLEKNGFWGHKPGTCEAGPVLTDEGRLVRDEAAIKAKKFGKNPRRPLVFASFFLVPNTGLTVGRPPAPHLRRSPRHGFTL